MKKMLALLLAVSLLVGLSATALADAAAFDAAQFVTWFEEEGAWRSVIIDSSDAPGGFVTDSASAPSADDLKAILHMASLAVTSGGKSDWYLVAVTDPAEQRAIIGERYSENAFNATATVLVFGERLIRTDLRTDENNVYQPDRGYYDAGIVTGYLNVAAIAKGFGTHMYMTPAIPGPNGFNDGDLGLDCAKYLEGTEYYMASKHESYSTENMKFVCAVVIGTPDAAATVETGLTNKEFPDNWIIWDK